MQAVILAGGKGTRLRPYTTVLPKPLMPIGDKAILEIVLLQLKNAGFNELIFTVGHLAELIEAYFGDGSKWGVKIRYSREKEPLGTAGPLSLLKGMDDNFIVMNGDILCDLDFRAFIDSHISSGKQLTICSYPKTVKIDLGVLDFKDDTLRDYIEKPTYSYRVSMGIYAMKKDFLRNIPSGRAYDFPDLVRDCIKKPLDIGVFNFTGKWYDIGSIDDYQLAEAEFSSDQSAFIKKDPARRQNLMARDRVL